MTLTLDDDDLKRIWRQWPKSKTEGYDLLAGFGSNYNDRRRAVSHDAHILADLLGISAPEWIDEMVDNYMAGRIGGRR